MLDRRKISRDFTEIVARALDSRDFNENRSVSIGGEFPWSKAVTAKEYMDRENRWDTRYRNDSRFYNQVESVVHSLLVSLIDAEDK